MYLQGGITEGVAIGQPTLDELLVDFQKLRGQSLFANQLRTEEQSPAERVADSLADFLGSLAESEDAPSIVARAIGNFDGRLYLWLVVREIDVDLTMRLFQIQARIEQRYVGTFELHVAAQAGRPRSAVIPPGFVDFEP